MNSATVGGVFGMRAFRQFNAKAQGREAVVTTRECFSNLWKGLNH
jgi:hypothetical protein